MKLPAVFTVLFLASFTAPAQDAITLYEEGLKLKEQKQIKEAKEKFTRAIMLNKDYTDALYELGWCRNDLKDYDGAVLVLRRVFPALNNIYKANFEMAYAFEKLNNYDSAVVYYTKCISIAPTNAGVYKQLGTIAYQKNDNELGLEYFAKYEANVKSLITDYMYWYRKGFLQNATKDYSGAKTSLLKSLDINKDYENTYLELGYACTKLKEDENAINYFKKAIEIDPKDHQGYNGVGEVYRDVKKDRNEAMNWYKKTLAFNSNERKANFGVGYCLNSLSKCDEAIPYLKKAIENEKDYTAAYVELGYSYYKTGNMTDALTNLNKAISINPKNENARYYKGLIFIYQKDKSNAQKMVDELKSLNSVNAASLQTSVNGM